MSRKEDPVEKLRLALFFLLGLLLLVLTIWLVQQFTQVGACP